MEREHAVSMSVTTGSECICNPEILLGTKYGLWDFQKEVAPRGTLLDLNAAWELFLSNKHFSEVSFLKNQHYQHEVIDGVIYEKGDITYTLVDLDGNPTGATFTVKSSEGPIEHIAWKDGQLILYYNKTRALTDEDLENDVPIRYADDANGNHTIDEETGNPLIFNYVTIPVIEIFDNNETHTLFPWYTDEQSTVRLRQNLTDNNEHLGDVAITSLNEVFIPKELSLQNTGNTLISILSLYNQLKKDLGFEPTFEAVNSIIDNEGGSIHLRATGSNIKQNLHTTDNTSLVSSINETSSNTYKNLALISGNSENSPINPVSYLDFNEYLLNRNYPYENKDSSNISNLLWALNNLLHYDLGDFQSSINSNINASNITEALNNIFAEAESNRSKIGYDRSINQWVALKTDNKVNLIEAINEIDSHVNKLAEIILVTENWDPVNSEPYYSNSDLNNITKNRLKPVGRKDTTTIIEDINDLLTLIGNLDPNRSGITSQTYLRTDSKTSLVQAINEVDLHTDNNTSVIGATYNLVDGVKDGYISNLTITNKSTIVDAINELTSRIGNLNVLSTTSKTSLVASVNELNAKQPFNYEDITNSNSGVVLKNLNNHAGLKSLVIGYNSTAGLYSFSSGSSNFIFNYSLVSGSQNTARDSYTTVFGLNNDVTGSYNFVNGVYNTINGTYNFVSGQNNTLSNSTTGSIVLGKNNTVNCLDIIAIGHHNTVVLDTIDGIVFGANSQVKGNKAISIGYTNLIAANSSGIGNNNVSSGTNDFQFGDLNTITGNYSFTIGRSNQVRGNNNYLLGQNTTVDGNNNIIIANGNNTYNVSNSLIIGNVSNAHSNSTNIAGNIYIESHNSSTQLLNLILVDLNDWCSNNNSLYLDGGKFLNTANVISAIQSYKLLDYIDSGILRFTMSNNVTGLIILQGSSTRIFYNGSVFFTNNLTTFSRQDGIYLKVINKQVLENGLTVTKHYLALMDSLSSVLNVSGEGALKGNDFGSIDLSLAYGAIDLDELGSTLNINNKVDKTAQIITNKYDSNGVTHPISYNFVDNNNPNASANITIDLVESFGINPLDYQKLSEKGLANGYAPLDANGKVPSQNLPSYVDDVIEVWAEYSLASGIYSNIHLYNVVESNGTISKGTEIVSGESGKIYVDVKPNQSNSAEFRWTGTLFAPIGSNLVIGEGVGTAYAGNLGKQTRDSLLDHLNSGTTTIAVDNGNGTSSNVVYNPNPHNVKAELLDVLLNDPNNSNLTFSSPSTIIDFNVKTALQELFDRINVSEDRADSVYSILGSVLDLQRLDAFNETLNDSLPTVIDLLLSYTAIPLIPSEDDSQNKDQNVLSIVSNYLKFYGEN